MVKPEIANTREQPPQAPSDRASVRLLARRYMDSNPGKDGDCRNRDIHETCDSLLTGRSPVSNGEVWELGRALSYRLAVMERATFYKNCLGIDAPDCHEIDPVRTKASRRYETDLDRYDQVWDLLRPENDLFRVPNPRSGWVYYKGLFYLAAILTKVDWSLEKVEDAITYLKEIHGPDMHKDDRYWH